MAYLAYNVRSTARHALAGSQDVADMFLKSLEEAASMLTMSVSVQNSALSSYEVGLTPPHALGTRVPCRGGESIGQNPTLIPERVDP